MTNARMNRHQSVDELVRSCSNCGGEGAAHGSLRLWQKVLQRIIQRGSLHIHICLEKLCLHLPPATPALLMCSSGQPFIILQWTYSLQETEFIAKKYIRSSSQQFFVTAEKMLAETSETVGIAGQYGSKITPAECAENSLVARSLQLSRHHQLPAALHTCVILHLQLARQGHNHDLEPPAKIALLVLHIDSELNCYGTSTLELDCNRQLPGPLLVDCTPMMTLHAAGWNREGSCHPLAMRSSSREVQVLH